MTFIEHFKYLMRSHQDFLAVFAFYRDYCHFTPDHYRVDIARCVNMLVKHFLSSLTLDDADEDDQIKVRSEKNQFT